MFDNNGEERSGGGGGGDEKKKKKNCSSFFFRSKKFCVEPKTLGVRGQVGTNRLTQVRFINEALIIFLKQRKSTSYHRDFMPWRQKITLPGAHLSFSGSFRATPTRPSLRRRTK
uniref:Uncharacterized protein n=1 Tax=Cacopsylla melanoneura TaxID=428564 RepID=A0A8D8UNQ0_9HEMI